MLNIIILLIFFICLIIWKFKSSTASSIENFNSNTNSNRNTNSNQKDLLKGNRLVVSLTTSPLRLTKIEGQIKNIMEQTILPDKIYLNVPHFFKRTGESYDTNILNNLKKKYPLLQINRCEDKGPVTKLYPVMDYETNDDTIIIIIDDDMWYENKLFEKLIVQFMQDPSTVLSNDVDMYASVEGVNTPAAYAGIIFKRSMFDDDFSKFIDDTGMYKNCYNSDDLIIGIYCKRKNIKVKQAKILGENKRLDFSEGQDALKNQDSMYHTERYKKCKQFIDTML